MKNYFSRLKNFAVYHFNNRFFVKQWIVGIGRGDIRNMIRNKTFNCDITWLPVKDPRREFADPFILSSDKGLYHLIIEDYSMDDHYGKVALLIVNDRYEVQEHKILLDTRSHLSYPFVFKENGNVYVFPESADNGNLSCYLYNPETRSLGFVKHIINMPLLDSNIIKHKNKYWIFGITREKDNNENYELQCFYSDDLLGPYTPHPANPLANGMDGVRSAGNIMEIDGVLYSPTQNCKEQYGKSISINKITRLNETSYTSEFHMNISIDKNNKYNRGIKTIHTINVHDELIVVDGIKWTFAPFAQHKKLIAAKAHLKKSGFL